MEKTDRLVMEKTELIIGKQYSKTPVKSEAQSLSLRSDNIKPIIVTLGTVNVPLYFTKQNNCEL